MAACKRYEVVSMNNEELKNLATWLPLTLAVAFACELANSLRTPIGADIQFHLSSLGNWLSYPPLFRVILLPSIYLNNNYLLCLQVLLFSLAVFSLTYVMRRLQGDWLISPLVSLIALGSYAYVDRAIQLNPQVLDFILLPIVIYASIKNRRWLFASSSILMFLNHSLVAIPILGGVFAYELRKWRKEEIVLLGAIIVTLTFPLLSWLYPMIAPTIFTFQNNQERLFWASPIIFMLTYQGLPLIGYFTSLWGSDKKEWWTEKSEVNKLCLFTLASLILMLPLWADRFVQYSTIPLSILLASYISHLKDRTKTIWITVVIVFFIIFYLQLWTWLLGGMFDV